MNSTNNTSRKNNKNKYSFNQEIIGRRIPTEPGEKDFNIASSTNLAVNEIPLVSELYIENGRKQFEQDKVQNIPLDQDHNF